MYTGDSRPGLRNTYLCYHSQTGERKQGGGMTSPFPYVLLLFHDFGSSVAQATHEPVVVVTDWSVPDRRKNVRRPSHSSKLFHNTGA